MRNLLASIALWLLVASFTSSVAPLSVNVSAGSPSLQENTSPTGHIAYIGLDHNIYIYDVEDQRSTAVTDDATRMRRYLYPTWSTDGRLAFFCCNPTSQQPVLGVHVL